MSTDPQKGDFEETLSATTDIDSLLQGASPTAGEDMFPADLGAPPGGLLGENPTPEPMEAEPASTEGERGAEEVEAVAEEEKKPGRLAVLMEKFDIYTSLLVVSLVAILLGCVFLWTEWARYGRDTKAKTAKTHGTVSASSPWKGAPRV